MKVFWMMVGDFGGGVGVLKFRKFTSCMGDEMLRGNESEDEEFK